MNGTSCSERWSPAISSPSSGSRHGESVRRVPGSEVADGGEAPDRGLAAGLGQQLVDAESVEPFQRQAVGARLGLDLAARLAASDPLGGPRRGVHAGVRQQPDAHHVIPVGVGDQKVVGAVPGRLAHLPRRDAGIDQQPLPAAHHLERGGLPQHARPPGGGRGQLNGAAHRPSLPRAPNRIPSPASTPQPSPHLLVSNTHEAEFAGL